MVGRPAIEAEAAGTGSSARFGWVDLAVLAGVGLVIAIGLFGPQLGELYPSCYDEPIYLRKVRDYDVWLRGGGWPFRLDQVRAAEAIEDMHPGVAKMAALLPHWLVLAALGREGGGRLVGGLFLYLACALVYGYCRRTTGRAVAAVAALGLASLPRVFGHAHFCCLDVPAMAMCFLAAAACQRAAAADRWPAAVGAGLAVGLALATKLNAVALVPHLAVWLAVARPPGRQKLLVGLLLAPLVFLACWPWLWLDPVDHLVRYLGFHGEHFHVGVTYLGRIYGGQTTAPASYPLVMLAVTTPWPWTLGLLGALVLLARRRLGDDGLFLALGFVAQLGLVMLPTVARYGGVRLFLPVFPFLVALVAMGLGQVVAAAARPRLALALAAALLLGANLLGIARTYPYCLSYYTPPLGLSGAARAGFEATYWGDAYAGARAFLSRPEVTADRFYAANELATGVLDTHMAAGEIPAQHRFLGRFVTDGVPVDADWLIVDNHPPMWPPSVRELVGRVPPAATVTREGVPLLLILPLRSQPTAARLLDGKQVTGD